MARVDEHPVEHLAPAHSPRSLRSDGIGPASVPEELSGPSDHHERLFPLAYAPQDDARELSGTVPCRAGLRVGRSLAGQGFEQAQRAAMNLSGLRDRVDLAR